MNTIIVEYDSFDMESRATIYKNSAECSQVSVSTNISELTKQILSYAYQEGIYNIKFHGPGMIRDEFEVMIRDKEKSTYSENKIVVEEI